MPQIVVVSTSQLPRFAGGHSFLGAQSFPLDKFTAEQLREIAADRLLHVVVGDLLEADDVDAFLEAAGLMPADAEKPKPRGRGKGGEG